MDYTGCDQQSPETLPAPWNRPGVSQTSTPRSRRWGQIRGELRTPHRSRWGQIRSEQWGHFRVLRPRFITFLLLHDLLCPGYDYLAGRKFAGLPELARGTGLEPDLDGFQQAAAELGFSPHVCSRAAERV